MGTSLWQTKRLFCIAFCLIACLAISGICQGTATYTVYNVKDYGATGNGVTDDTAAFQAALNAAGNANGGVVYAPSATYNIASNLNIPAAVTLEGDWKIPVGWLVSGKGTTLLASASAGNATGTPFIFLNPYSTLKGVEINYPNQNNPSSIVAYPFTVRGSGDDVSILDTTIVNPYQAVDFATYACGRYMIRNLYGQPLLTGITVDQCYDVARIENVHFWPFWSTTACTYTRANGKAFTFGRTDWQDVLNTFCYGYEIGYYFISTTSGNCNGNFQGIGADDAAWPVYVTSAEPYGLLITNGEFVAQEGGNPIGLYVSSSVASTALISLNNCSFWGASNQCVSVCGGHVQLTGCNFANWNSSYYALLATGGHMSVVGCNFSSTGTCVKTTSACAGLVAVANTGVSSSQISNAASNNTIADNIP
jgi:hypothetical protein